VTDARAPGRRIAGVRLFALDAPLARPYKRAYVTDRAWRPLLAEIRDRDGRTGLGEAVVSTGYTDETPEGAWDFLRALAPELVGLDPRAALDLTLSRSAGNENGASVAATALEMLGDGPHPALAVPLLAPVQADSPEAARDEAERLLAEGYRTLKVKVGFDAARDLAFVSAVREAAAGRADIRIDANQGYSREQALAFAAGLDPDGIALFEQPCGKEDWAANLAVARVSPAPVMLDESVVRPADIERAGAAEGVGFVKLKLKKTVTRRMLAEGLARIRALGMTPVMGDGVACAIACWHEALVARTALDNAGEMNGYLKPAECFLAEPLGFREGRLTTPAGWRPVLDEAAVLRMTAAVESC